MYNLYMYITSCASESASAVSHDMLQRWTCYMVRYSAVTIYIAEKELMVLLKPTYLTLSHTWVLCIYKPSDLVNFGWWVFDCSIISCCVLFVMFAITRKLHVFCTQMSVNTQSINAHVHMFIVVCIVGCVTFLNKVLLDCKSGGDIFHYVWTSSSLSMDWASHFVCSSHGESSHYNFDLKWLVTVCILC